MPTPIHQSAREAVREVCLRLGMDIDNEEQVQRVRDNLQWITDRRAGEKARAAYRSGLSLSVITALLGAIATSIGEWIFHHGAAGK